jgi:multidrug transporter EmrE-like cation transporter
MADILDRVLDDSAMRYGVMMGIIETFADGSLKKYAQTDDPAALSACLAGYGAVLYVFQLALRKEKLGRVNAWWNSFTSLSNVAMGMAMGETYEPKQLLGFVLISAGILMI